MDLVLFIRLLLQRNTAMRVDSDHPRVESQCLSRQRPRTEA